jgi:hypothetical protein
MRNPRRTLPLLAAGLLMVVLPPWVAGASPVEQRAEGPVLLASGLEGGSGSTIGPDGALYVTEGVAGRLTRIDPETRDTTVVARCLPEGVAPVGGAIDVAFRDGTPYVLVSTVDPVDAGRSDVAGIYRIDGVDSCTVVADIDTWPVENPPDAESFLPPGVQDALEPYRGGFLVTDGQHNRVLFVTLDGAVDEVIQLPDVVPTGLDVKGSTAYLALAVPHRPEDGRVVSFRGTESPVPREVAFGAPWPVDVEGGCGRRLFVLAQGVFPVGEEAGGPALPGTGQLLVSHQGDLRLVADRLDRPSSLEIFGTSAYVVTLDGDVWRIADVCREHRHDGDRDP